MSYTPPVTEWEMREILDWAYESDLSLHSRRRVVFHLALPSRGVEEFFALCRDRRSFIGEDGLSRYERYLFAWSGQSVEVISDPSLEVGVARVYWRVSETP
jgi:hypothetical protein